MKEELNIDIKLSKFLGFGMDKQYNFKTGRDTYRLLMFFHAKIDENPKLGFDGEEIPLDHKWLTFDEIKNLENKEGALVDFFSRNQNLHL